MLSRLVASLLRARRRDFAPPKCSPSIGPMSPRESQSSKLDERFLSGPNSRHSWRKLPFFNDLHHEISRSWKQPFSSRLTNVAAADFTNLVGSVEQGYTAIPVVENTLTSHLSLSLAPMWKSRPLLPTKPCRTTSALIGSPTWQLVRQAWPSIRAYQAYQADVRKEMDESLRFARKKKFFFLTPPSLKLGCLERQSALWWRNFDLSSLRRLPSGSSCLGAQGPPPPPCPESAPYRERSPPSGAAPRLIPLRPRSVEPAVDHCPTDDLAGRWI